MPWEKIPSLCVFTIHSIRLPRAYLEPFQVEWKRGETKGMTERALSGDDNVVSFEKPFKCSVTVYLDSKEGVIRPKHIAFSFIVWRSNKRRVYGKGLVDVGMYFRKDVPETVTIEIDSPHSEKAFAVMSFATNPTGGGTIAGDDDVASVNEVMQLATDRIDEWDVSEAVPGEGKDKLDKFLAVRREKQEQRFQLAQFKRPGAQGLRAPQPRHERLQQPALMGPGSSIAAFMTTHLDAPPPPRDATARRKAGASTGRQDLFAASLYASAPPISDVPEKVEEPPPAPAPPQKAGTVLKSILGRQWSVSPLDSISVPAGVTAILGCFVHIDLFANRHQRRLVSDFLKDYETADLIGDASLCDKFLHTLSLWNCALHGPRIDHAAAAYFAGKLIVVLRSQFLAFIAPFADSLVAIAEALFDGLTDPESAARQLTERIEQAFRSYNFPDRIESLCRQQLIRMFDARCVALVTAKTTRPTAEHAVGWNSTLTICEMDRGISLPLFREAAMALQGSMALCADPTLKDVMTPGLPPEVVLNLLAAQRPDDFCPIDNDVTAFSAHFNLTPDKMTSVVPVGYDGSFEELRQILSADWDRKRFKPEVAEAFPFLAEFVLDADRK
jgi:hypothetical protein